MDGTEIKFNKYFHWKWLHREKRMSRTAFLQHKTLSNIGQQETIDRRAHHYPPWVHGSYKSMLNAMITKMRSCCSVNCNFMCNNILWSQNTWLCVAMKVYTRRSRLPYWIWLWNSVTQGKLILNNYILPGFLDILKIFYV